MFHSFNKSLFRTYYIPGTILVARYKEVKEKKKKRKRPLLLGSIALDERLTHIKRHFRIDMKVIKKVRWCDVIASTWQVTLLNKRVMEGISEEVTVSETLLMRS